MGNRHSSYKKKTSIYRQHSFRVPQEHVPSTVDGSSNVILLETDKFTGPSMEPTKDILNTAVKQCPPTPCPALYIGQPHEIQANGCLDTAQRPFVSGRQSQYTLEPVTVNKEDDTNISATELENGDNVIDDSTRQCHEADNNYNSNSMLFDDDDTDVYDIIPPPSNTNLKESFRTNTGQEIPACSFENPEYFTRGCYQRSSQQTNSSIADSAYTASTNNSGHNSSEDYICLNCVCRGHTIEYMTTDVYRRTLQRDLRVEDVLQDIHCIDDLRKEEIEKKSRESRQGAVEMLLESIRSSNEEGKWQNFIEALERADCNFIVKLLKGETENDQEKNKKLLSLLSRELINNIHVDECLDMLYEEELLNEKDKEEIESELKNHGPIAAAYKMFNIVPTRSDEWDRRLSGILDKCGLSNVAKLLQFSQESPASHNSDQTEPKKVKCTHSKHHYEKIPSGRYRHALHHHEVHGRTNDAYLSPETGKVITELSKHVKNIEENTGWQLSAVRELEATQNNGIQELKQTADEAKEKVQKLNEQEILFHNEIKTELKSQSARIEAMEVGLDELKQSVENIKYSLADLTKLIDPSPPEACQPFVRNVTADSGFSGGWGSFPEEFNTQF